MDFIIGFLGTIFIVLPSYLIILIIYKIKGYKGSIFFTQYRAGLGGKKFKIIKFRSMVENAEEILELNEELYEKYKKIAINYLQMRIQGLQILVIS
jgi:wcjG